jgi:DNA polymerase
LKENDIDSQTITLLKQAVDAQLDFGLDELVVNAGRISKKKKMIMKNANTKSPRKTRYKSLASHNKAICNCNLCPLVETRTKFVYGVGNPNADIMFIGEAPGRDEDLKGEPFVGRAGQLLDKILAAIKFKREDVYIANMLKCRPPNNRDPLPEEMAVCFPYLDRQIRLIKPKIICALGRIAAQALLQTSTPLGKLRKRWHDFNGILFMVTYHPAALLRFQSYKKDTWEDVQMLRAKYDELMAG